MKWYRKTALVLLVSAACAALAADVETPPFFDALKEDGAWFKLGGTSWAWQPAVMQQDPGWRPYLDGGSWTRHEANWFWVSEYAWGAIAFHHGRWIETEAYGWLWVPGTQWCPAWVDWRLTSTHSGWAPLPPDDAFLGSIGVTNYALSWQQYAFVPNGDFLARELRDHLVDATGFTNEAVMSFAGPEPHQVGYVAPDGLGSAATVIVQEREVLPAYEICSTVYLREPVLAYSPCHVHLDFGDGFYARHPPACRPPVRVRRPNRGRHSSPPPPAPQMAQTAPARPRPPDAIVAPPPRPPSTVVQRPPRPPGVIVATPPRPPSTVVQRPPRPPEVVVQRPPLPPSDEAVTSSASDRQSSRSSSRHSPTTAVAPKRGQVPPTRAAQGGVSANPPRGETANRTAEPPGAASPFRQTRARKR